jgi:endonuclease/exonuclease/phosphatase family metal-dependent hydrolase
MLKVITLNIESDNHYDKIFSLFQKEKPDVVCLQEVYQVDMDFFSEKLKMTGYFSPMVNLTTNNKKHRFSDKGLWGVAIFTNLKIIKSNSKTYFGDSKIIPEWTDKDPNCPNRVLAWIKILINNQELVIANTHFTWSGSGAISDLQRQTFTKLLNLIDKIKPDILCGDFNTPRGSELFDTLTNIYTDNVPENTKTTVDNKIHKAKAEINLVVDGLFTKKTLKTQNPRVVSGVSDHQAVVVEIQNPDS